MLICSFYCLHASQLPPTHTHTSKPCVCVWVWKGGLFIATRVGQLNLPLPFHLTLLAPTSLIVKCMQTVSEYSSHCCCYCCCCCYSRDWCCSGCRYFCASDGNTFINFTAGHWQRQQAPPVASCQLPVALSLRLDIFFSGLTAAWPFLFCFLLRCCCCCCCRHNGTLICA